MWYATRQIYSHGLFLIYRKSLPLESNPQNPKMSDNDMYLFLRYKSITVSRHENI